MWERSFLAMSVALGEPWAEAFGALGDRGADELAATMGRADRQKKAEAVARELGTVALDVERLELVWR